jgi:hypothetical protein
MNDLEKIFQSAEKSSQLPMLTERLNILHETGSILLKVIHFSFIEKNIFN